jgi:hypothetical protein
MIKKECCVLGCRKDAIVFVLYIGGFSKPLCSVHYKENKEDKILYYKKAHMKKYKSSKYEIRI